MANITAFGSVTEEGVLSLSNRKRLEQDLLQFKGCTVELTIKKKNHRSTQQNRYYFGVVVKEIEIRMKQLGNDVTPELVHEFLKDRFNKKHLIGEGGEIIDSIGGSTTELNKEEFMIYVDKIIEWAASVLSIEIKMPNTDLQFNF